MYINSPAKNANVKRRIYNLQYCIQYCIIDLNKIFIHRGMI